MFLAVIREDKPPFLEQSVRLFLKQLQPAATEFKRWTKLHVCKESPACAEGSIHLSRVDVRSYLSVFADLGEVHK